MPVASSMQRDESFPLDVPLHNLLTQSPAPPTGLFPVHEPAAWHRQQGAGLYGGKPMLRPDLIHRITYNEARKNLWIVRLMRAGVIDELADVGSPGTWTI